MLWVTHLAATRVLPEARVRPDATGALARELISNSADLLEACSHSVIDQEAWQDYTVRLPAILEKLQAAVPTAAVTRIRERYGHLFADVASGKKE